MSANVIIDDKVYIKKKLVDINLVEKHYEKRTFKQKQCNKCVVFQNGERFNDICSTCPAYTGLFVMHKEVDIEGEKYISVPAGDIARVQDKLELDFKKLGKKDTRVKVPFKSKVKFTGQLYHGQVIHGAKTANQVKIVDDFMDSPKSGFIVAPPRVGKTVIGVCVAMTLGMRTIVMAQEQELLKQFRVALKQNTNYKKLERETGKKIVALAKTDDDFKRADVVLTTYQKFITKRGLKRLMRYVKGKFGLVVVDEAHLANAFLYSKVIASINARYKLMLTATVKRKDGAHVVMREVAGPVLAKGKAQMLIPDVIVHDTKVKPKYEWQGMSAYTKLTSFLAEHKDRNKMLVKQVFRDLRENKHHKIIIPCLRINQVKTLVKMINNQALYNNDQKKEKWDDRLAVEYHGKSNRDKTLKLIREDKDTRVIVAIVKMCKLGLNVLPLTHMYIQHPMNNEPDFFQLSQRICTPAPNKPKPVLRMFVDDTGLSRGCFIATWFHGPVKLKMDIAPLEREKANLIMEANKNQKRGRNRSRSKNVYGRGAAQRGNYNVEKRDGVKISGRGLSF